MGHSRNSSAATERPSVDRGMSAPSTATSPTAAVSGLTQRQPSMPMASPSPHRHELSRSVSMQSPTRAQLQRQNTGTGTSVVTVNGVHADHHVVTASPHRSPPSGSAISTALLVSSCTKLFPILLVIWPTTGTTTEPSSGESIPSPTIGPFGSRAASYIGWVVLFNNIEALMILLQPESGYLGVTALAVAGFVVRFLVEGCFLSAASLAADRSGPVGDFLGLLGWVNGRIGL